MKFIFWWPVWLCHAIHALIGATAVFSARIGPAVPIIFLTAFVAYQIAQRNEYFYPELRWFLVGSVLMLIAEVAL